MNPPELIIIKNNAWLEKQRHAGKVVAQCLSAAEKIIKNEPGTTLKHIESICEKIILDGNCSPTFKNYKGYPGVICASVNEVLVHGIPSNYKIKSGDIIKIDVGATYDGVIGDAAITAICGNPINKRHEELVSVCKKALDIGIEISNPGRRIGEIGYVIDKFVEEHGFNVIDTYGGHGINIHRLHAPPFVPNKSDEYSGIRIVEGMSFTIEPMITWGGNKTKVSPKDGWSVRTGNMSAHFEHTLFIGSKCAEIITKLE